MADKLFPVYVFLHNFASRALRDMIFFFKFIVLKLAIQWCSY